MGRKTILGQKYKLTRIVDSRQSEIIIELIRSVQGARLTRPGNTRVGKYSISRFARVSSYSRLLPHQTTVSIMVSQESQPH